MMTEIECPSEDCDYSTDTKRGLSIHFSAKHPEEEHDFSSKKSYTCDFCGDTFKRYEYRVTSGNKFCSKECKDSHEARDGLDTECAECGEDVHVPPSHMKEVDGYEQKNYFCDKECESSFKSREWVGEDHPSWDGGREQVYCNECGDRYFVKPSEVEKTSFCSKSCQRENWANGKNEYECANCGETIEKYPYNVKGDVTTCSKECFSEYMSSIRRGEDNPQWDGGKVWYYGPSWSEMRRKALKRDDYECKVCGMTREESHDVYGIDLDVHHKIPAKEFEQVDDANFLINLVTTCRSCHWKLDEISRRAANRKPTIPA